MAEPQTSPKFSGWQRVLVRWAPFGGTTGLMVHAVLQAQVTQTVILALGTALTSLWVAYSESFMTCVGAEGGTL